MNKVVKFLTICFLVYPSARLLGGVYDYDAYGNRKIGGGYDHYGLAKPSNAQYGWPSMPSRGTREPTPPKVLPASVISYVPPTQKQMEKQERKMRQKQDANERPLVKAAREGNLQAVQRICCSVPGKAMPEYNFFAFSAAVEAGHNDVAQYLAYQQPACNTYRKAGNGDELYYYLFWFSVMHGDKASFDFFMTRGINVHQISKERWSLYDDDGVTRETYYNSVHVNAISFLRTGYAMYGASEGRRYIEWMLGQRGLTDAPPVDYSSGGGGCCEVQ